MPSKFALSMLRFQAFLLRKDWLGPMGDVVMVVTTTGRRSGKPVATPIGYVRDGDLWAALTYPTSNWYRNLRKAPEALLEIRGRPVRVRTEFVDDEPGRQRLVDLYRQQRAKNFRMFFNVAVDAPAEDIARGVAARVFVRFHPLAVPPA